MTSDPVTGLGTALLNMVHASVESARAGRTIVDWRDAAADFSIRLRLVRLRKRRWWLFDNGPILAFRRADGMPVVLIRGRRREYRAFEPSSRSDSVVVDAAMAATLKYEAFMPYPGPAPKDRRYSRFVSGSHADALFQIGYATVAVFLVSFMVLGPLFARKYFPSYDFALLRAGMFVWMALAAAVATAEYIAVIAGLRWRVQANILRHAFIWNRVLGFPFARFRVLPSTDFAARIDDAITAGNDADAQKFVLRLAVPGACAAFLVLVLVSPGLTALAGATLIILFGAQYALTRAFETCVRFENTQAPRILRTRNLLASHLPGLRSLGALDWALDVGRVAANEELTARAHSEVLRLSDESLRRFGPIFVVLAIVISLAAGAGRNLTFSSLSVILFSGLWLGSEVCRVASAWAGLREANKRTPAQSSLMEPEPAMPPQQSRLGEIATVVFERASFVYSGAAQPSLEDVSFELRKGDCVAVVGPSGSGKTTLVRLLTGLEHPTHGKIRVNGFDLRVADVADYRRRVGAVFQDQHVEVATIRRTILGTTPIPEEQAWAAARLARISDRIASLPMGMQTLVARATVPSAMVNQLLIARALVRRPEILVFDEALSNLDETVQSGLIADLQAAGTMVVICTHRPSTMALATRVIRLEHGRMLP